MSSGARVALAPEHVAAAFARRADPVAAFGTQADTLAATCQAMARWFHRGGRLLAMGTGVAAADAAHVAVEFVHPVIVGKRALPALALSHGGTAASVELFGGPDDIALVFSPDGESPVLAEAMAVAAGRGLLTVALLGEEKSATWPVAARHARQQRQPIGAHGDILVVYQHMLEE